MKTKLIMIALALVATFSLSAQSIYDFKVNTLKGIPTSLSEYKGKTILIVNTASKCGLTPQYEGLEALYQSYKDKGFVILAFPCNQFLGQEPGTAEEIEKFCTMKYNVTFPIFEKIAVNGEKTHPLYVFLKSSLKLDGKNDIRWNFEKFLIDRTGKPVKRFSPTTKPAELKADIEVIL